MGIPAPVKRVLRAATRAGCTWRTTGNSHLAIECPNGTTVWASSTPKNAEHGARRLADDLRKIGGVTLDNERNAR